MAVADKAPVDVTSTSAGAVLLAITYDATGLVSAAIVSTPLVAWVYDNANPAAGATPVGASPMPPMPPSTGAVISPQCAIAWSNDAVWTLDGVFVFVGTFPDFLTWLATNNGANRTLSARLATTPLVNAWNQWRRINPTLVS